MRRFLTTSFILLALVVGTVGAAPTAHAQLAPGGVSASSLSAPASATNDLITNAGATRSFSAPAVTGTYNPTTGTYGNAADAATASQDAALSATAGMTSSSVTSSAATDAAAKAAAAKTATDNGPKMDDALGGVMSWIMSLFAWLLGVAAITLDNVVYYTVVTMGDYVNKLSAIGVTWRILRDIGNIALIFGFLAVGITTILNVNWYGSGKKMLPMMLVAAVFLNFSLFISEAIIDTGNLFATQFYTQINGGVPAQPVNYFSSGSISNEGISNKIMSQLGLAQIYGSALTNTNVLPSGTSVFIGFMSIILFIVAAFVMFSLAFVLVARFVALIFLIILAPIGFAGLAIPQLAKRAGDWWSKLFEQTVTAPILLLMLYIALAIITDANFLGFGPKGDWTGFVPGNGGTNFAGFASILLSFIVAMGLLMAVVIQSKNLSAFGAAGASKLAGKLTFGATALAGRTTVGWGANRAAKYLRTTAVGRIPLVGTGLVKGLDKVATGSFDVRGATIGGGLKAAGIDAGAAQKGGYRADLKTRTESRTKYAKDLTGRAPTAGEREILGAATQAENARKEIETTIEATRKTKSEAEAEVKRIEGEKQQDRYWETNSENVQKLQEAKDRLAQSMADLGAKETLLTQAKTKEKETAGIVVPIKEATSNKTAQEKYASVLELGLGADSRFNKTFNFAANTEAAKKIREEAKKSKEDKELDTLRKALKKIGGEEEKKEETPKPPEANKTNPSDT